MRKICFDLEHAFNYGLKEALIIALFKELQSKSEKDKKGLKWIEISRPKLVRMLPFMNNQEIKYVLMSLVSQGVIVSDNNESIHEAKKYAFVHQEFHFD